jgi:hypothetical protein
MDSFPARLPSALLWHQDRHLQCLWRFLIESIVPDLVILSSGTLCISSTPVPTQTVLIFSCFEIFNTFFPFPIHFYSTFFLTNSSTSWRNTSFISSLVALQSRGQLFPVFTCLGRCISTVSQENIQSFRKFILLVSSQRFWTEVFWIEKGKSARLNSHSIVFDGKRFAADCLKFPVLRGKLFESREMTELTSFRPEPRPWPVSQTGR